MLTKVHKLIIHFVCMLTTWHATLPNSSIPCIIIIITSLFGTRSTSPVIMGNWRSFLQKIKLFKTKRKQDQLLCIGVIHPTRTTEQKITHGHFGITI